ncbi:uncharacterized protein LOC113372584 isoform X3 [Ctenocephalides felis]|nr:uncharacterized protein LOC113372584 isoform X3 [Ctenocephalides felis]XP_026468724.1 uncharacterized protein LOC113372584 isoform X3 [Ctenocephalides felis]
MLLEPIARTSLWREDDSVLANYDDNGLFCGGRQVQWELNGGKCGICGDDYALPRPRPSELGGMYDFGKVPRKYLQGGQMPVGVMLTANHLGYFKFALCPVDVWGEESEECFAAYPLNLTTGEDRLPVPTSEVGWYNATLQLPEDVTCRHCVVQWTYITGNSWGICPSGEGKLGCGQEQENFRTCSDIAIFSKEAHQWWEDIVHAHQAIYPNPEINETQDNEIPEVIEDIVARFLLKLRH